MKPFIFENITIAEALRIFKEGVGTEYELKNGEIVTIHEVSELKEILIGHTNLDKLCNIETPDGALIVDEVTDYDSYIGFTVTVRRKTKHGYEQWGEQICIPLSKCCLENGWERSLLYDIYKIKSKTGIHHSQTNC